MGIAVFLFSFFIDLKSLKSITRNLNGIIINVSLTFIAFSVTALSLLSFVYNRDWFKKIAASSYFKSFIDRFFWSVRMALILLIISVLCIMFEFYYSVIICSLLNAFFVMFFMFLSLWTWSCVNDLISIFKEP
jgi:hypothetical protein